MKFTPKHNQVLLEPVLAERGEKRVGSLYIPSTVVEDNKDTFVGLVVAVGPGARNNQGELLPMSTSVGETVVVTKYAGMKLTLGDTEHRVVTDIEVLGSLE